MKIKEPEIITLKSIVERRMRGEFDLAEFVEAVSVFAAETDDEELAGLVKAFDVEAEDDIEAAEKHFEEAIIAAIPMVTAPFPDNSPITQGYPNAVTPAQLAMGAPLGLKDFKDGLTYTYPRIIGKVNVGTAMTPVWEERYELISRTVNSAQISYELQVFKRAIKAASATTGGSGGISLPVGIYVNFWNLTITTSGPNQPALIAITNPLNLTIDWGDGTIDKSGLGTHIFAAAGTYTVKMSGTLNAGGTIKCSSLSTALKGTSVIDCDMADFSGVFTSTGLTGPIPTGIFDKCPNANTFATIFSGCSSLSGAIPANLFAKNPLVTTFQAAFATCSGLSGPLAANLFANNPLAQNFQGAFNGCTWLTSIPATLFASNVQATTFFQTFNNTGITAIPATLFANNPLVTTFQTCFGSNAGLANIPIDLFRYNPLVTSFAATFTTCPLITSIPADIFRYNVAATDFNQTFRSTGITSIVVDLFRYCVQASIFIGTFRTCTALTAVPAGLFDYNVNATDFTNLFQGDNALVSLPAGLFKNCNKVTSYNLAFSACSNLVGPLDVTFFNLTAPVTTFGSCFNVCTKLTGTAQTIWVTYSALTGSAVSLCFKNCTLLSNYASIPAAWK